MEALHSSLMFYHMAVEHGCDGLLGLLLVAEVVKLMCECHMVTEVLISSHRRYHCRGLGVQWCGLEKFSHDLGVAYIAPSRT
jgi:hypothetical protein